MAGTKTWAVVTGAGHGIGAALTRHLTTRGLHVLAVDKDAEALRKLNSENNDGVVTLHVNLRDPGSTERIAAAIPTEDTLRYVIQNAAVVSVRSLAEITRDLAEETFTVDVVTPLLLAQKLTKRLASSNGRILHLDVKPAHTPWKGVALHGIAKASYYHMYRSLNGEFEYGGLNVRVANVQVGAVDTPSFRSDTKVALEQGLPLGKLLKGMSEAREVRTPEEAARFISYLLLDSDDKEFSTREWCITDSSLEDKF